MRVLVVGHERSATTWIGHVLGETARSGYVNEPDDPRTNPFAIRAMAGRGTLPLLSASDPSWPSLTYLWDVAFGSRRPRYVRGQHRASVALHHGASVEQLDHMESPGKSVSLRLQLAAALGVPRHLQPHVDRDHHVVKSVHAPFMIDWIRARWDPTVVVCFRHPLDVIASVRAADIVGRSGGVIVSRMSRETRAYGLEHYGVPLPTDDDQVACLAWRVGLVMSRLADECRAHPEFHVVDHARICESPSERLRELVAEVGLSWTDDTEAFVASSNRPGTTWQTTRVASEQRDRWRSRLTPGEVSAASEIVAQFPIASRYDGDLGG
jgi:hypothetical protein